VRPKFNYIDKNFVYTKNVMLPQETTEHLGKISSNPFLCMDLLFLVLVSIDCFTTTRSASLSLYDSLNCRLFLYDVTWLSHSFRCDAIRVSWIKLCNFVVELNFVFSVELFLRISCRTLFFQNLNLERVSTKKKT